MILVFILEEINIKYLIMLLSAQSKKKNLKALIILGGPSIEPHLKKIKNLESEYLIFVEARAITPLLVRSKIKIDYIFCAYPEKLKDNALQNYILRSFCSNVNIKKFIKKKFYKDVNYLKNNFNKIYENWNEKKGIHKKFRIKKNVYLKNSPLYLLKYYKKTKLIINLIDFKKNFSKKKINHNIIKIRFKDKKNIFSIKKYLNPKIINNTLEIDQSNFLNVAATSILPVINKMKIKETFLIGMDMNMLGTMEYSVKKIFKSFFHFLIFFLLSRKAFNHNFKLNFPLIYLRPRSEFLDFKKVLSFYKNNIYNVNEKSILIGKIKNIKQINYQDFFKINFIYK